jgi:F-type H+-transporting ATPase subunit b
MLQIDFSLWPPGTLWIQVANFLMLLLLMNIFLYRPIRKMLTQRRAETSSLEGSIEDFLSRSGQNEKSIEDGLVLARKEGYMEKEGLRGQGLEAEKALLQKAGAEAEEKIRNAREEMEKKMIDVRKTLQDQVAAFSEELAEKILGRGVK